MKQGLKDRLFYLYVSQSDIIDGYDDLIPEAVEEVLEVLEPRPRVFFLFVSCLDDLIGTDHEALLSALGARHPEIAFRMCHMNPISLGSRTPPPVSIQNNLYSLLAPSEKRDEGINAIGNLEPTAVTSELYHFLSAYGVSRLRHISQYETLNAYQEMAGSRANLVIGAPGRQAAGQMEERLGIPWIFMPVTYDMEEIEDNYRRLKAFLFQRTGASSDQEGRKESGEISDYYRCLGRVPALWNGEGSAYIRFFCGPGGGSGLYGI